MIKKIKLLILNFAITTTIITSNSLTISTSANSHYPVAEKIIRNKRQTETPPPRPVLEWDLGDIEDNRRTTILTRLHTNPQFLRAQEIHGEKAKCINFNITNITSNSAFVSRIDSHGNVTNSFNIRFHAQRFTLSSIVMDFITILGIPPNSIIPIDWFHLPVQDVYTIMERIVALLNNNLREQNPTWVTEQADLFYRAEDLYNNMRINSYIGAGSLILENIDNPEERFTINCPASSPYLQDYLTSTDLGIIAADTSGKTKLIDSIDSRFYNINPLLRTTLAPWSSRWHRSYDEIIWNGHDENGFLTGEVNMVYIAPATNVALQRHNLTLRFKLSKNDTETTTTNTPFTDKQDPKDPDANPKPSSSKRKSDSQSFTYYDQPGASGENDDRSFSYDKSRTNRNKKYKEAIFNNLANSATSKAIKNYNLGAIKSNQKDTIINTLIDNNNIEWKQQKPVIADFHFLAITPTSAKIKVTTPMHFIFKNQSITLKVDEIINLSFNVTDQITSSSILRLLAQEKKFLPLFMWTNDINQFTVTDAAKNLRKTAIIDQIFSWLQYLKLAKPGLPASLLHITNADILYDDENITVTELKLPQNKFGEVIITLKISTENEVIRLKLTEYDIRVFFADNNINFIRTENSDARTIKALKVYFKNVQLQINEFVDQINNQAKQVVKLGCSIDQSDSHILNALIQYAEKHKIKNRSKMAKLIFNIWTKQPYINLNIFITVNNNKGKIIFPGGKIINIFVTTQAKPDFAAPNTLLKYNYQIVDRKRLYDNKLLTKFTQFAVNLPAVDGLKLIGSMLWYATTSSRFDYY